MPPASTFTLAVPHGFDLSRTICSYGYFLLAPNFWDPKTMRFHRPLRGTKDRIIRVTLSQPSPASLRMPGKLRVACDIKITADDRGHLIRQLSRILRLDEPPELFARWHKLHPGARRARFARMFRSPTLFEDIIKTFTGCNVTWRNTMTMNRLLCEHIGGGAFPTPSQIAARRPDWVKRNCKVGYRAQRIVRLARDVDSGRLDLAPLGDPARTTDEVFEDLTRIYGIGDYAAGNLCQLLGRYDRLAIDTETYRHFEQEYGLPRGKNPLRLHPRIEKHYARFAPFQFLAYWFELWQSYERRFGSALAWGSDTHGPNFTASNLK